MTVSTRTVIIQTIAHPMITHSSRSNAIMTRAPSYTGIMMMTKATSADRTVLYIRWILLRMMVKSMQRQHLSDFGA
jgi:hypothetical protein